MRHVKTNIHVYFAANTCTQQSTTCTCTHPVQYDSTSHDPYMRCVPWLHVYTCTHVPVCLNLAVLSYISIIYMINETSRERGLNKAKPFNSPEEVFFPKKNGLPQVGFKPTTLLPKTECLSYQGSSVDIFLTQIQSKARQIISTW